MPKPIDLQIEFKDGKKVNYYIPLRIMRGEKPLEQESADRKTLEDWPWTNPEYVISIPHKAVDMKTIEIDPSQRMADVERGDNKITL